MKHKFKGGQRVMSLVDCPIGTFRKGDFGTVCFNLLYGLVFVDWDSGNGNGMEESEIELI